MASSPISTQTMPSTRNGALRDFVSLLGSSASIDGSISEGMVGRPKTRLDLLLLREEEMAGKYEEPNATDQIGSAPTFSFPSLSMFAPLQSSDASTDDNVRKDRAPDSGTAEQIASRNLGRPVHYSRSDVPLAPDRIAGTAASTFASLIGANLRQVLKTLAIRRTEMKPIKITKVSTSFNVSTDACNGATSDQNEPKSSSETEPLHFKIEYDVIIDGKMTKANVDGTGFVTCQFARDESPVIKSVCVTIDTSKLLRSLREQARIVALFALMAAASANGGRIGGNSREIHRDNPPANGAPCRCVTPEPEPDLSQSGLMEDLQSSKRTSHSGAFSPRKRARL